MLGERKNNSDDKKTESLEKKITEGKKIAFTFRRVQ